MVMNPNHHILTLFSNHYPLIAGYYIHLARLIRRKSETPRLDAFIVLLETKSQCERELIASIKTENHTKYRNKWTSLCISDMHNFCDFSG